MQRKFTPLREVLTYTASQQNDDGSATSTQTYTYQTVYVNINAIAKLQFNGNAVEGKNVYKVTFLNGDAIYVVDENGSLSDIYGYIEN